MVDVVDESPAESKRRTLEEIGTEPIGVEVVSDEYMVSVALELCPRDAVPAIVDLVERFDDDLRALIGGRPSRWSSSCGSVMRLLVDQLAPSMMS